MIDWLIWFLLILIILLIVLRYILIWYAKRIPNFGDQEPYIIDINDENEGKYHCCQQWLNYQEKCKILCIASKSNESEIRMYKRNTNTYRSKSIIKKNRLNFNELKNVICINIDDNYCDIEGSTTYDTLVYQLLKYGYIPTVVPELKSITVGGAIVGVGIESSSFKYGLCHESMIECDILLSNGNIITCNNNNKYCDLFKAIPNSLGSLGYILRIRMKIIKCKKYVHLTNISCINHDILAKQIINECNNNKISTNYNKFDFIEGIAYFNGTGRILIGKMIDNIPNNKTIDEYTIFHQYININDNESMIMPIDKYLWRWDSDLFWCLQNVSILNNKYIRWYLGEYIMRSDVLRYFHGLIFNRDIIVQNEKQIKDGNQMYIQDIIVPQKNVRNWLRFHFEEIVYLNNKTNSVQFPLWLCPTKGNETDYTLISINDKTININFGFWCSVKWNKQIKLNKFVENNLSKYNAFKTLYSAVLFEKHQFYKIYNGNQYFKLKKKYDKDNKIRHFYEKCTQK